MQIRLCRMWWHKWFPWSSPIDVTTLVQVGKVRRAVASARKQVRSCEHCGLIKERYVS